MDKPNVRTETSLHGVTLVEKRKIWDERGGVFHMLRRTDPEFRQFGEIYFSLVFKGAIKAWKLHKRHTLNLFLVSGAVRLALLDARADSPTLGKTSVLELTDKEGKLVIVPPGIWSGFQGLGEGSSILANCSSDPHDPEESDRREPNHPEMPKIWN